MSGKRLGAELERVIEEAMWAGLLTAGGRLHSRVSRLGTS